MVVLPVQCKGEECRVEDRLLLCVRMPERPAERCEDPHGCDGIGSLSGGTGF